MKITNEMKLTLLSRSINEGLARASVATFVSQLDPTLDELGDIKTAVSEAVTNSIVHAYPDQLGKVYITARILEGNWIELIIKDHGKGIDDVHQARQAMFTTGGNERSGMGFTIMESFMDSLRVRSVAGKGTTLTMRRHLSVRVSGRAGDA